MTERARIGRAALENDVAMIFLIQLFGAAALLLWGLRMVRTGVLRAFGSQLRSFLGRAMGNRISAFFGGLGSTLLLQSSSATALITSSFASRKVVTAGAALAIMLGADVGTSLVAQAYALKVTWISPLMILIGYIMFNHMTETRTRDLGRAIIGLGLTLLGLAMITLAAEPMRDAPVVPVILKLMAEAPISGVIVGAALTIASTSSLAIILLVVSFATHDLIPVEVCYALVLGANLGSAVMPIIATLVRPAGSAPRAGRQHDLPGRGRDHRLAAAAADHAGDRQAAAGSLAPGAELPCRVQPRPGNPVHLADRPGLAPHHPPAADAGASRRSGQGTLSQRGFGRESLHRPCQCRARGAAHGRPVGPDARFVAPGFPAMATAGWSTPARTWIRRSTG